MRVPATFTPLARHAGQHRIEQGVIGRLGRHLPDGGKAEVRWSTRITLGLGARGCSAGCLGETAGLLALDPGEEVGQGPNRRCVGSGRREEIEDEGFEAIEGGPGGYFWLAALSRPPEHLNEFRNH